MSRIHNEFQYQLLNGTKQILTTREEREKKEEGKKKRVKRDAKHLNKCKVLRKY